MKLHQTTRPQKTIYRLNRRAYRAEVPLRRSAPAQRCPLNPVERIEMRPHFVHAPGRCKFAADCKEPHALAWRSRRKLCAPVQNERAANGEAVTQTSG